ncbi:MAG: hypothetical protein CMJ53_08840 [Planctomycetaceae bacterium]|nr:hypothetical protein [Planctomycetaceae bacterium]
MSSNSKTFSSKLGVAIAAMEKNQFFEAEASALKLLEDARGVFDYDAMAAAIPVLKSAREARAKAALEIEAPIHRLEAPIEEGQSFEGGCWLIDPPRVAADGRTIRATALEEQVPVIVLCREPMTRLGLRPIVSIGRTTVRTKIEPAADMDDPDLDWFLGSIDLLGDHAISTIDTGIDIVKQIDGLLDRLSAIPEHPGLHDALEEACMMAANALRGQPVE